MCVRTRAPPDRARSPVVADDQRPGRLAGLAVASVLRLVDHTLVLGMVCALAVGVAGSVFSRAQERGH
jgi:hypothetical protein